MKTILGISALYHDSAAAIVRGGTILAAAQEERFTRKKADPRFPRQAINYCLAEAFIEPSDLDAVVYYDNPALTMDRLVKNFLAVAPAGGEQWARACESMLGVKFHLKDLIQQVAGKAVPLLMVDHHMAHAASAFYPSPFERAAIVTVDGVGEWATTSMGRGFGSKIELEREIRYPHSLGLLYSAVTAYCGFKINSGEYKLMGLAPYGEPSYVDLMRSHLIDLKPDGSYRLNLEYFGFADSDRTTNQAFHKLFGGPPREAEGRITRKEMDLAASVQAVLEEAMLNLCRQVKQLTGEKNLVLAGGVALNCVANGKILRSGLFDSLWIQPAAGDAGGALGAALLGSHAHFGETRVVHPEDSQQGSYLGPSFSSDEIQAFLERLDCSYHRCPDNTERNRQIAQALSEGKVVGHFSGRMEFGPRSLGNRSILGDSRRADTQSHMNLKIKYRESFRPFAPAVLEEKASEYFELEQASPYMLLVAAVRAERRLGMDWQPLSESDDLIPLVNQARSDIPAITHVDYSARVQTVSALTNPTFHSLIKEFEAQTGCAVIVNTSFNVRGEPIVCSPEDAYRCFMRTGIDLLVMEDCLVWKSEQPEYSEQDDWRQEFDLD